MATIPRTTKTNKSDRIDDGYWGEPVQNPIGRPVFPGSVKKTTKPLKLLGLSLDEQALLWHAPTLRLVAVSMGSKLNRELNKYRPDK